MILQQHCPTVKHCYFLIYAAVVTRLIKLPQSRHFFYTRDEGFFAGQRRVHIYIIFYLNTLVTTSSILWTTK